VRKLTFRKSKARESVSFLPLVGMTEVSFLTLFGMTSGFKGLKAILLAAKPPTISPPSNLKTIVIPNEVRKLKKIERKQQ